MISLRANDWNGLWNCFNIQYLAAPDDGLDKFTFDYQKIVKFER